MALIETVADHEYASAVEELSNQVRILNQELREQKSINENLFFVLKNLTDSINEQSDLLKIMSRNQ